MWSSPYCLRATVYQIYTELFYPRILSTWFYFQIIPHTVFIMLALDVVSGGPIVFTLSSCLSICLLLQQIFNKPSISLHHNLNSVQEILIRPCQFMSNLPLMHLKNVLSYSSGVILNISMELYIYVDFQRLHVVTKDHYCRHPSSWVICPWWIWKNVFSPYIPLLHGTFSNDVLQICRSLKVKYF